jgi:hypothetical protein
MIPGDVPVSGPQPHVPDPMVGTHPTQFLRRPPGVYDVKLLPISQAVISFVIAAGCIWIILAPTNQQTTNAAFALLGTLIGFWLPKRPSDA